MAFSYTTKPFIYVALDEDSQLKNISFATKLAENVQSIDYGFKINLDSVANFSPEALSPFAMISAIKKLNKPIFVDMKMWNGGRTMENIAIGCSDLGVDIINIYPHAGKKFIERVKESLEGTNTKLFGLTVLTHYTDDDTRTLYCLDLRDAVKVFADMAKDFNLDGIIVPGTQLNAVKDIPLPKLCPGIRPSWFEDKKSNDQEQTVTPYDAIMNGANYIVVGSPIQKSKDPVKALEKILSEISYSSHI